MSGHTLGPWEVGPLHQTVRPASITSRDGHTNGGFIICDVRGSDRVNNARLIAAAPELLEALKEGRRAIGEHFAPNDCYATGPVTGDEYLDLVQCPACSFIAMYDAVIAKATGDAS